MTTTISAGATTITPAVVLGYETSSESGNTVHAVIGAEDPAVTLGVEGMRSGTLEMAFITQALAWAARAFLKTPNIFTLASTDATVIGMRFVRTGRMSIGLDPETLSVWVLTTDYQEVV